MSTKYFKKDDREENERTVEFEEVRFLEKHASHE